MHPSIIYNKRNVLFQRNTKKIIISEDIDKRCEKIRENQAFFQDTQFFDGKYPFSSPKIPFLKLDSQN